VLLGKRKRLVALIFLRDSKAQMFQLLTYISLLHNVSSLHNSPQKKAMNALPYFMFIFLISICYAVGVIAQNQMLYGKTSLATRLMLCFFYSLSVQ